jgi:hypothetical protein
VHSSTDVDYLYSDDSIPALDAADFTAFVVFSTSKDSVVQVLFGTNDLESDGADVQERISLYGATSASAPVHVIIKDSLSNIYRNDYAAKLDTGSYLVGLKLDGSTLTSYNNGSALVDTSAGVSGVWNNNILRVGSQHMKEDVVPVQYNSPFTGYICEIIIYNTALSDVDRQAVENYLNDKYNLY